MGRELLSILVEAKFPAPFLLSDLLPLLILCSTFPRSSYWTFCTFGFVGIFDVFNPSDIIDTLGTISYLLPLLIFCSTCPTTFFYLYFCSSC